MNNDIETVKEYKVIAVTENIIDFEINGDLFHMYVDDAITSPEQLDYEIYKFIDNLFFNEKQNEQPEDDSVNDSENKSKYNFYEDFSKRIGETRSFELAIKEIEDLQNFEKEQAYDFEMEKFRQLYRRYKKEQDNLPIETSIFKRARSFSKAIPEFATRKYTDAATVEKRVKICEGCSFLKDGLIPFCSKCGCSIFLKTKLKSSTCPIGKW